LVLGGGSTFESTINRPTFTAVYSAQNPHLSDRSTMADKGDPNPSTAAGGATSSSSASTAAMLNQPIVIDCGSSSMKAGFAGGTKPKVCVGIVAIVAVPMLMPMTMMIMLCLSPFSHLFVQMNIAILIQGIHRNQSWARQTPTRHARWRPRGGRAAAAAG